VTSRLASSLAFFTNGFILANWIARIPAVAGHLGLSSAQVGTALLGMAIGALLAFPATGRLITRFGSARVTLAFGLVYALALPLLAFASSLPLLFVALLLFGVGNGGMDVAMNAQGVETEKLLRKPILNSLHGFFSLGGLAGAALGGGVASLGLDTPGHFLVIGAAALLALAVLRRGLVPDAPHVPVRPAPAFALPPRALWGLGAVGFCAAIGEGAIGDWSALYLRDSLGTSAGTAALGYAAFSLAMLIGRFLGDPLVQRFGPALMVRGGAAIAALGLAAGLGTNTPLAVMAGFAAVGLGLSVVIPLVYGAAGSHPTIPRGTAVAAVATIGYSGFLLGPPLLGWLAQASSLRLALAVVIVPCALIVFLPRVATFREQAVPATGSSGPGGS
jgi:MFS family permease